MKYIALITLIVATLSPPQSNAQEASTLYKFDCSTLMPGFQSKGCFSYNEMILKGDKDLMNLFKPTNTHIVVCFRPEEDVFFIISYEIPADSDYHKSKALNELEVGSLLNYIRYKDGVLDTNGYSFGKWTKIPGFDLPAGFSGKGKDSSSSVSNSEVSYSSTFENLNNTTTNYIVQIRLSTLRFSENYTAQQPPSPPKSAKAPPTPTPPPQNRITYTGYCADFKTEASH